MISSITSDLSCSSGRLVSLWSSCRLLETVAIWNLHTVCKFAGLLEFFGWCLYGWLVYGHHQSFGLSTVAWSNPSISSRSLWERWKMVWYLVSQRACLTFMLSMATCLATLLFLFLRNYSLAAAGERISSTVLGDPTPCRPSSVVGLVEHFLGPSVLLGLVLLLL